MNAVALSSIRTPLQVSDGQSQDALPHSGTTSRWDASNSRSKSHLPTRSWYPPNPAMAWGEGLNVNGGKDTP